MNSIFTLKNIIKTIFKHWRFVSAILVAQLCGGWVSVARSDGGDFLLTLWRGIAIGGIGGLVMGYIWERMLGVCQAKWFVQISCFLVILLFFGGLLVSYKFDL